MEDWAEIRRLYRAAGLPIKQIAMVMNVSLAVLIPPRSAEDLGNNKDFGGHPRSALPWRPAGVDSGVLRGIDAHQEYAAESG